MNNRTDLINLIARKINAQRYIEIGVYNPDHNFNKIEVPQKMSVDPDPNAGAKVPWTSDRFFDVIKITGAKVDLVFIDGLHHADQVKRDIENAWDVLNPGGVIVLHDCNPPTEATTCVPRGRQREWCGDVYRTIIRIKSPVFFTVDFDYGCCVIRKGDQPLEFDDRQVTWEQFDRYRFVLLQLVRPSQAIQIIEAWT